MFFQAGSVYGSSDLILDQTHSQLLQQRRTLMREEKRKRFWKSFAIFLSVMLVVAIVVALSIYITHGRSTIVKTTWGKKKCYITARDLYLKNLACYFCLDIILVPMVTTSNARLWWWKKSENVSEKVLQFFVCYAGCGHHGCSQHLHHPGKIDHC